MFRTKKLSTRLMSLLLCLAMVIGYFPAVALTASSVEITDGTQTAVADPSTMEYWKTLFGTENPNIPGGISTRYAGGVWTDKSVFTSADAFEGVSLTASGESMLVSLSAIGSNATITGRSDVPTDTMIVLDISGSMNGNYTQLINAANSSIATLMEANEYNRVGVALYASSASLLMPLDHYTPGANGRYINYSSSGGYYGAVSTANNLRGQENGSVSERVSCGGGTYMQSGLAIAMDQFNAVTQTTVTDPIFGTVTRKPIVVLMTDGDPTHAHTSFTDPGNSGNVGNGTYTTPAMGFMVQLTAAYLQTQVEQKYGSTALFYTLGFNVDKGSVADNVMNPGSAQTSTNTTAVNDFWLQYTDKNNTRVNVGDGRYVDIIDTPLNQKYVTSSYTAGSGTNALLDAFEQIIADIAEKTAQFPTLVQEHEDISGYVAFVDNIGSYMAVTDVKGILMEGKLYSGEELSKMFDGSSNVLGTVEEPTELGDSLIYAVKARLGVDGDVARTLVANAYTYGQLHYSSAQDWSNYIGWYGNAAGDFLNFYHEGVTVLPEATGDAAADPVYTYKSYGYLGSTDTHAGVAASDMMYTVVHVRTEIATGAQQVSFGVPAALLPLVTYNVTLDENGDLSSLTTEGASTPICLLYEVALREEITSANLTQVVDPEYLQANTDPATGEVYFYSNLYETAYDLNEGTVNTYAYFNPALSNSRYYYTEPSVIYSDDQGTLYSGTAAPSGDGYYRTYTLYEKSAAGALNTKNVYVPIDAGIVAYAERSGDNWIIPAGHEYESLSRFVNTKAPNATGTLSQSHVPFVDTTEHVVGSAGTGYYVGTVLGNNGRISVTPATGITVSKAFEGTDAAQTDFTFSIAGSVPSGNYEAQKLLADGTVDPSLKTVTFAGGMAAVSLKAGESVTVTGLPANTALTVTEELSDAYKLVQINGAAVAGMAHTLTTQANQIVDVTFTNANRGKGRLEIAKAVELDESYDLSKVAPFQIQVQLAGLGVANAQIQASKTGEELTSVQTDANGVFTTTLTDGQTLELIGLYEGVTATVTELNVPAGFTPSYWENGVLETQDAFGQVTVQTDNRVSVIIQNQYQPSKVDPVDITALGVKYLKDADGNDYPWDPAYSFTFQLERLEIDGQGNRSWILVDTVTVNEETAQYAETQGRVIQFPVGLSQEQLDAPGTYYYRIRELSDAPLPGFTYDTGVHAFALTVGDADMDGQLEITQVNTYGTATTVNTQAPWVVNTSFTNVYDTDNTDVVLDVYKSLNNPSGSLIPTLEGFTFQLWAAEQDPEDPEKFVISGTQPVAEQTTTGSGLARITLFYSLSDVGTYHYIIKERDDALPHWTYDSKTELITVDVHDDGQGNLTATVSKGSAVEAAAGSTLTVNGFVNTYTPDPAKLPVDFVSKNLTGRDMAAGEFQFVISQRDPDSADTEVVMTGTNGAAAAGELAAVTFVNVDETLTGTDKNCLIFHETGTFFFDVKELSQDSQGVALADKGVTSDTVTYRLVVTVSDVNGQLTAAYRIDNSAVHTGVTFTNSYVPQAAQLTLEGNKVLRNKTMLNGEFTFLLQPCDASGEAIAGTEPVKAANDAAGHYRFPAMTYTEEGTWYYLVSEFEPESTNGIEYDTNVYMVTVTVTDDGQGSLVATDEYRYLNGGAAQGLDFTNTYTAKPSKISVSGDKTLTGKTLGDGMFEFQLKDAEGIVKASAKNNADGLFTLDLTHTEVGTYFYTVSEVGAGTTVNGVTYDDTVYTVRVEVTDDLRGQLHSAITIYDGENIPVGELVFQNEYNVYGTANAVIPGSKTLEGRPLKAGEFTFQLYDANADFETTGTPETVTNALDGTFSFTRTYEAEDVGKTFYYVVKEAQGALPGVTYSQQSYRVSVEVLDNGDGTIKTRTTIENGTAAEAAFRNTYKGLPVQLELEGTKHLEGIRPLKDNDFTFLLYQANEAFQIQGDPIQSVQNKADGTVAFADQPLTDAGTYYFVVCESSENPIGGVAYDPAQYHITVVVKDNKDGYMGIESMTVALYKSQVSQIVSQIVFNNSYTAQPVADRLEGTKQLTGNKTIEANMFEFLLKNEADQVVDRAKNDAEGNFVLNVEHSAVGTYTYTVSEAYGGETKKGITYDDTVYTVTVVVTDNENGQLESQVTVEGVPTDAPVEFTNSYGVYGTADAVIPGSKTLEGRPLKAEEFTFQLYDANADFETTGTPETVTNALDGTFSFTRTYGAEDVGETFYYVVKEAQGALTGVTYSQQSYRVSVEVLDNGDGTIKTRTTIEGGTAAETAFRNTYKGLPVQLQLEGTKHLEGIRPLKDNDFTFLLYQANETFQIQGDPLQSVQNKADGTVAFADQPLTDAGTYYFVVCESSENPIGGVAYDPAQYHITVVVEDDLAGSLVIASQSIVWTKGQSFLDTEEILFTNSYTAQGAAVQLTGSKTLEGRKLAAQEFAFLLLSADSSFAELPNTVSQRAFNKADGSYAFDELVFTQPGTYYYVVREDAQQPDPSVTYDQRSYHVTVTVTDDENGKLTAAVSITEKGKTEPASLTFKNIYTEPAPQILTIPVIKTVENKGTEKLSPEGFRIRIEEKESGLSADVLTDKNGKAELPVTFEASDVGSTYTFLVYEVDEGKEHVTYSEQVYTYTVEVSLSADNTLQLAVTREGTPLDILTAGFVNVYDYTKEPPATPATGDGMNLVLWMTLLTLSGGAVITLMVFGKKKEEKA